MQKLIETRTNGLCRAARNLTFDKFFGRCERQRRDCNLRQLAGLRGLMRELQPFELKNKIFVLCMKGVEIETGMRLSQVCAAECDSSNAGCRLGWSRPCTGVCGRCAELHGH